MVTPSGKKKEKKLSIESQKKIKKSPVKIKTEKSDSLSDSDFEESSKLLNKQFIKSKKKKHDKEVDQQNLSVEDDTSDSSFVPPSGKVGVTHQQTDVIDSGSDSSVDKDIYDIAKKHMKLEMEEMSDFSIHSPMKTSKKKSHDFKETENNVTSNSNNSKHKKSSKKLIDSEGKEKEITSDKYKLRQVESLDEDSDMSESILSTKTKREKKKKQEQKTSAVQPQEQILNLRYKIPKGFEPAKLTVSKHDSCIENLENKEVWLIKAPINFDIKQLDGVTIDLEGRTDFNTEKNDYYEVTATEDDSSEMATFTPIFPSMESSSFVVGPKLKGQIHVLESLEIPPLPPVKIPEAIVHRIPEGLHPRFEPFGSGTPLKTTAKRHHHEDKESDSPHKSHKRKHQHDQDKTGDSPVHSKEKKVKKEKKIKKEHS